MTKPGSGVKPPKVRISLTVGSRRINPARIARGQPAEQAEQLGTGHAAGCGMTKLEGFEGDVLVCCGDMPLLKKETFV